MLFLLILVAVVVNLNLSVANVALPDIGKAFASSQYRAQDTGRLAATTLGSFDCLAVAVPVMVNAVGVAMLFELWAAAVIFRESRSGARARS